MLRIKVLGWHPSTPWVGFVVVDQQVENATKPMHQQNLEKEKLEDGRSEKLRSQLTVVNLGGIDPLDVNYSLAVAEQDGVRDPDSRCI